MDYGWNTVIEEPLEQGWIKWMIDNNSTLDIRQVEFILCVFNDEFKRLMLNEMDEKEKLEFIKHFALEEYYKNNFEDEEFTTFRNLFKEY